LKIRVNLINIKQIIKPLKENDFSYQPKRILNKMKLKIKKIEFFYLYIINYDFFILEQLKLKVKYFHIKKQIINK